MSDTPATDGRGTVGVFLVLAAALTIVWATGSWLGKMFDWTHQGFASASLLQLAGYLIGGALQYLAIFSWPVLLARTGRTLSRHRYTVMSGVLLGAGLTTFALTLWSRGDAPVTTWPHWLLLGVTVQGTLAGLAGLGHCACLARKSRMADRQPPARGDRSA
ncbi:hypothetical protein [Nonomuraea sp. C10]|uniref:hypothetical protein n=1 Tax=Nonomuraea sp. C10 TaxID=2600577 RepID=UPI0011CEC4A0|nr:hypothetical protein [Nonomuraea sp. C10]TXK35163.1 hypothetical protein FR742_38575 [Nonomuraea sp. C10]